MKYLCLVYGEESAISPESVAAEAWGDFLCAVFDEWIAGDIGRPAERLDCEQSNGSAGPAPALTRSSFQAARSSKVA